MSPADIDAILDRHPNAKRDALIPVLQEVQEAQGFLSRDAVIHISRRLGLPASKVFGVATFYNQFRFQAIGRNHIQCCRGTACHVKGSASVLQALKHALQISPGETTRDGQFSLEVVACVGACGLAPVITVNGAFHAGVTPDSVREIINSMKRKAPQNA